MNKGFLYLLVFIFGIFVSSELFAQDKSEHTIYMKNGSIIRGEIIKINPKEIRIKTKNGSIVVVKFKEVNSIKEGVKTSEEELVKPPSKLKKNYSQEGYFKHSIGIGSYALSITNNHPYYENDNLGGFAFFGTSAFTHNIALRYGFFFLKHNDYSEIDNNGFEMQVLFGNNFDLVGFKIYGGIGFFSETWEYYYVSQDFSGFQLSGGLGYNWKRIALEYWFSIRQADDYEAFIEDTVGESMEMAAVSGCLLLSFRF